MITSDPLASLDSGYTPAKMGTRLASSHYPVRLVLVHPARWQWFDGASNEDGTRGAWLPQIGFVPAVPGVGNCGTEGDLGLKMMPARTQVAKDGWTVCDLNEWGDRYLYSIDGDNGPAYLLAWQAVGSVGGNVRVTCDEAVYHDWLRKFADKLPPPDAGTVEAKIAEATTGALSDASSAQANPMMLHAATVAAMRVQRMRAGAGLPPDPTFARLAPAAVDAPMVTTPAAEPSKPARKARG